MNLFDDQTREEAPSSQYAPLAERMRPRDWDDLFGQEDLTKNDSMLRLAVEKNQIPSMIFWGPPGSGKTTLARLIARKTNSYFVQFSAVTGGVKNVREIVKTARERQKTTGIRTLLFIDEVHRFNKAQQDAFLPHVEDGTIILIGATTENPSFEVNSALLSRCKVFVLKSLHDEDLTKILQKALKDRKRGLGTFKIKASKKILQTISRLSDGDARVALNALEFIVMSHKDTKTTLDEADVKEAFQRTNILYDRAGDEHYNTISAFIKSMRAGAVDAALYYLARMVEAGEDPKFIARRMVVFASEDIGMAQPTALVVANEVFRAVETIGYPECAINLAHGVVYLASQKKDRRAYDALRSAQADVKNFGSLPIPKSILNAPTKLMKDLGYGADYEKYPDDKSLLLPEKIRRKRYFRK